MSAGHVGCSLPGPELPAAGRHGGGETGRRGGGEAGRGDDLCPDEKAGESQECLWEPPGEFIPLHGLIFKVEGLQARHVCATTPACVLHDCV